MILSALGYGRHLGLMSCVKGLFWALCVGGVGRAQALGLERNDVSTAGIYLGAPWRKLPQGGLTQARRKAKRQGLAPIPGWDLIFASSSPTALALSPNLSPGHRSSPMVPQP